MSIIDDLTEAAQHLTLAEADRLQILAAAKDQAVIDGVAFDLRHDLIDVYGTRWHDTGARDADGQPLMQSRTHPLSHEPEGRPFTPVPLLDVYLQGAPLVSAPHRPSRAEMLAALEQTTDLYGGAA